MAENNCVVCFKNFRIYSIGECDHPVCFECSARMRVLCCQNECPMCRHEMDVVVFTEKVRPFRRLNRTYPLYDKQYNIAFENDYIRDEFENLLQYVCPKCYRVNIYDTFESLKEHMKRIHDLYCCDLCAENLKIFPGELRYYTRQELSRHKKIGDVDNRSHRGHPLCELCLVRYLDRDELYKHLRKDHFFCHICDAEGLQQFYGTYLLLRDHYRERHYLCEEDSCIEESMTSVFPTEIDLKAHKALNHFKNSRNKLAVRQARTLDLEFALPPRSNNRRVRFNYDDTEDYSGGQQSDYSQGAEVNMMASLEQNFPSLGKSSSYQAPRAKFARESNNRLTFNDQNFPALGSEASINLNITNNVNVRPSTSGSTISTNISVQVDHKKPKEKKGKNAQNCRSAPAPSSSSSLTWVEKAKEKPQLERTPVSAEFSDLLPEPPQMNRKNFPNLKKNVAPCPDLPSNKTVKKNKRSPTASSDSDNQSSVTRVNYSEAIVKNVVAKDEKADAKNKNAPQSSGKSKNAKEERSLNLNRDNKTHSFLLNANRKKVKMKPEVLVPLNDLKKNPNALSTRMEQLKLTSHSTEAQKANNSAVIEKKVNNSTNEKQAVKGETKAKTKNGNAVIDRKVNNANEKINKEETKGKTKNGDAVIDKKVNNANEQKTKEKTKNGDAVIDKKVSNMNGKIKDKSKGKMRNGDEKIEENEMKVTKTRERPSQLASEAGQKVGSTTERPKNGTATEVGGGKNASSMDVVEAQDDDVPPRTKKSPPGFEKPTAPPPPPGFDQLTKSKSSSSPNPDTLLRFPFVYQQPNEFVARNSQLIEKVSHSLVRKSESALNEFKRKSLMFRNGEISASDYYVYCIRNIEADKFMDVFVELIALLPDIMKQQELWAIHQVATSSEMRDSTLPVNYCPICYQILKFEDSLTHYSKHGNEALMMGPSLTKY